jgi:hypothetical protein
VENPKIAENPEPALKKALSSESQESDSGITENVSKSETSQPSESKDI